MTEKQYITAAQAARLKKMSLSLFYHYINSGRGPEYGIQLGRKAFDPDQVLEWFPIKRNPGRPKLNG